ncbi:T-cell antigen CD7 [Phodopus roborovskii]|uniref:Cd7 protein n=1 Tax=Phodopus roborovskii TaxID=109678 RepID=A0AAU9YN58_PHORO|nr:T-cell antigen CD7 [Phodopus roborovskii]CAH6776578.1 Cd7 [Phodopus roborovskii]
MTQETFLALLLTLARVLPGPLDGQEMQQSYQVHIASEGESINITCSTSGDLLGIYLKQIWPWDSYVTYFEDGKDSTVDKRFSGRIDFSGSQNNLTITLRLLVLEDTGVYTCKPVTKSGRDGSSTIVVVREKLSQEACKSQELRRASVSLPAALAVGFFLLGLSFGVLCSLRKTQIKELCASRDNNSRCVVYEDMSYSNRKTPCTLNQYQ